VGSNDRHAVDVRVIAATNRDLESAYRTGTFRKDLYFRLNVVTGAHTAAGERRADVPMLVHYFLNRYTPTKPLQVTAAADEEPAAVRLARQRARTGELHCPGGDVGRPGDD